MITPGLLKPKDATQNTLPIEAPPPTGTIEGGIASFFQNERHNLLGDEVLRGEKLFDKVFDPGKTISPDEWKNDPELYRPGLGFEKSRNIAKVNADSYDREGYLNDEMDNMKNGVVPWSARFIGGLIGQVADPNNIAMGYSANFLMGPGRAFIFRGLQEATKGAQIGAEMGLGAVQQGLAFTPASLANYDVSDQLGQNPTALSVVANIGAAAGLGSLIHGVVKYRQIITNEAHETALETATAQAMNGQRVDVEPVVKQGYNEARANEEKIPTPDMQAEISARLKENIGQTEEAEKALNKALDEQSMRQKNRGVLEQEEKPLSDSDMIEKALKINEKSPITRSLDDNLFLKGLPQNEEFQQALSIESKPGFQRTQEENIALRGFRNGEEPRQIAQRLEDQKKQIANLKQQLGDIKELDSKKAQDLKAKLGDLTDRVKSGEDRLQELAGHGSDEAPVREARQNVEAAKAEGERLNDLAQAHGIELRMDEMPELPVTPEDVENVAKKQGTWENDTALDPEDVATFDKQIESIPDSNEQILSDIQSAVEDMKKAGSLEEEDLHILDELKRYEEASDKYEATLKAFRDCITGGRKS